MHPPALSTRRRKSVEDVDRAMLWLVGIDLLLAVAVGHRAGLVSMAIGMGLACSAPAGLAVWWRNGRLASRLWLTASLVALVALQIQLSAGALPSHFNVFITLSVLLAWRDWRPIAFAASLFALHHVGFDRLLAAGIGAYCLSAPDPTQIAIHVAFVATQCAILCHVALTLAKEASEAEELAFLVHAMGEDGPIRLHLDVIRTETAAGARLKQVQQRMGQALRDVRAAADAVRQAAHQLASDGLELSGRTDQTAKGLGSSSECLDNIGEILKHSRDASDQAKAMSANAASMAGEGGHLVGNVVRSMQDIGNSSRRITDIIGVIDGIAFQTNILALNAAVEAARAGEQGRGFAVVAAEVRSLAQRSAAAAREIKGLISASAEQVERGTQLVGDAGNTMNTLVNTVCQVGELFESISRDGTEHAQGLAMVTHSVGQLALMTQDNVTLAGRASHTARELEAQVDRLSVVLDCFRLGSEGPSGAPRPAASPADIQPGAALPAASVAPGHAGARLAQSGASVEFF